MTLSEVLWGKKVGGQGGIRTLDTVTRMPHFECGAFNRSATCPKGADHTGPPLPLQAAALVHP